MGFLIPNDLSSGILVVPWSQPLNKVMVEHKIKVLAILLLLGMELNSMVLLKVMFKSIYWLVVERHVFMPWPYVISFVDIILLLSLVVIVLNVFRGPLFISQEFKSPHTTKTFISQENRSSTEQNVGKISFIFSTKKDQIS